MHILIALAALHALIAPLVMALVTAGIDLSPIVNQLILPLLAPIVLAGVMWLLAKLAALAHFNLQAGQRALVMSAIDNAIAFAEQKLAGQPMAVTTDQKVAAAVNYLLPKIPATLAALNVTPAHLGELVAARIPQQ